MRRARLALLLTFVIALPAFAQKKELTLEMLYNPATRVYVSGAVQSGFQWLDDSTFIWPRRSEKMDVVSWQKYDLKTGKETPYFDRAKVVAALKEAGVSSEQAEQAVSTRGMAASLATLTFDAKKNAALVEAAGDLFVYSFAKQSAIRLTSTPGEESVATFSPDGKRVAFVRDNDLWVVDVASQRERRLTTGGNAQTLNGILDWVYEEEIYGRGAKRGYWWSADSSRIAYLHFDEKPVPDFTIVDHIPYHGDVQTYAYPKAGDPNPLVKLMIVPAAGGDASLVDTEGYSGAEHLIVAVAWNKVSGALTYEVQNREQTWLDFVSVDPAKGSPSRIIHETTPTWVNNDNSSVEFLADGSFLWLSERDGYRHIYHYKADGTLIRQVTKGEWEVRDLHGIDEKSGTIYFSGTERSPIGSDVYRVSLDGTGLKRLSEAAGTHSVSFSPSFANYVDNWSDVTTPSQTRVHRSDGTQLRLVEENRVAVLSDYDTPKPEFLQVKTRDGFPMEAMIIKPSNFDASKKYPVFQYLYAGPHSQTVLNAWRPTLPFYQLIANQGVVVWMCDNRTASGKGSVTTWPVYKHFGESELRDIEDGIAYLKSQPWIDGTRVALSGWSFGGFMTSYALTHSTMFSAGIAGGSVTDWRDYDSVYTERYMLMPQNNPEGYKASSPRWAAKNLHGNLLLIHGTIDDNVHMQNTLQFAYELEKAGKPFQMKLYPKSRHGVREPLLNYDLQRTVVDFVKANLLGK